MSVDPPFELDVYTARELCELPDPPQSDRLLGPLVVRGSRTVVVASTGHGKSTFSTALVAAVVDRREFLGWTGAGGRALILDLEQGLRTAKRRLTEAGLSESGAVEYVRVPDGLRLDQHTGHRAALEQVLAERSIDLVTIDPYYKAHGLEDSNEERSTVELMRLLDGWRERYSFALILPTHTRKRGQDSSGRFTIDDAFGSSALTRGAEVVLGVDLVKPGYSRLHFFKDRDGGDDLPVRGEPWGLLFDRDSGNRRDPADTEPPRDLDTELLALAADNKWRTLKEWKAPKPEGVGANEGKVRDAIESLVDAGRPCSRSARQAAPAPLTAGA